LAELKVRFKQILIAVDDSEFAAHAADVGIELAKTLKANIGFVHVFDPSVAPGSMWSVPADQLMEMSEQEAKNLLAGFRERTTTGSEVREFLESGKAASKIVDVAKSWPADLVVMGSHGRGKIGGLLLGSVSQGVLSHAPCPVLVVRAKP
jgi:nucleotide-binding universal stress UspA family protein